MGLTATQPEAGKCHLSPRQGSFHALWTLKPPWIRPSPRGEERVHQAGAHLGGHDLHCLVASTHCVPVPSHVLSEPFTPQIPGLGCSPPHPGRMKSSLPACTAVTAQASPLG